MKETKSKTRRKAKTNAISKPRSQRRSAPKASPILTAVPVTSAEAREIVRRNVLDLANVLNTEPPIRDHVLPGLPLGELGVVLAPGGVGKSFFMLQNAVSVAVGEDRPNFWGSVDGPAEIKSGGVFFLSLEDDADEMHRRICAAARGLSPAQIERLKANATFCCQYETFSVISKSRGKMEPSVWITALSEMLHATAIKPRLLVIDTLNRSLGGVSENNSTDMGYIVGVLRQLAKTQNVAICLIHHTSKKSQAASRLPKASDARGSSALTDNSRWVLNLVSWTGLRQSSEPNEGVAYLITKANYGPSIEVRFAQRGTDGVMTRVDLSNDTNPFLDNSNTAANTASNTAHTFGSLVN